VHYPGVIIPIYFIRGCLFFSSGVEAANLSYGVIRAINQLFILDLKNVDVSHFLFFSVLGVDRGGAEQRAQGV
jgi:hypothetical protein